MVHKLSKVYMAWLYLLLASLLEIVWTTALKYSEGFTRLVPVIVMLILGSVDIKKIML